MFFIYADVNAQHCTSDTRYTQIPYFDSTAISMAANVQFGIAPDYLGNPYVLRMDVYYPNLGIDTATKRPFFLLFHGGGFVSGDKQSGDIKDLCIHLARRGFVCATVNYRLGFDFSEYEQYKARYRAIQDGHAAMRHIVNNANALRIDTNWLFVGGQSAGSLLALGMVYADDAELDSISLLYNSTSISTELGNLNASGNALSNTYQIKGVFNNWGAIAKNEIDANEMIPTISFHGALDTVVLIDADTSFLHYTLYGSKSIHDTLLYHPICTELNVDLLGGHGIFRNESSEFRAARASCFFKSIFCQTCTSFYTNDSIPVQCTSIQNLIENDINSTITIYPNPAENIVTLKGLTSPVNIKFYNIFGQLVQQNTITENTVEIQLPAGMYSVHITEIESNKTYQRKIIVKN